MQRKENLPRLCIARNVLQKNPVMSGASLLLASGEHDADKGDEADTRNEYVDHLNLMMGGERKHPRGSSMFKGIEMNKEVAEALARHRRELLVPEMK